MFKISSNGSKRISNDYLTHVDGIRAIAVLAVILFHANAKWLPGGFVGVDMFFVISGYLISQIIHRQTFEGSFSLKTFYVKRIRRIIPLLVTVIIASFPIAWFVLLPDEMRNYSESIFTSLLMYSNQYFLVEAGYFDTESHFKPLLHTWSLSIEAQFYFIFPILFVLLIRHLKHLTLLIALMMLGSFVYADIASFDNSEKSFFYFFSRAWEMLAGCLIMLMCKERTNNAKMAELLSLVGFVLVLFSFVFFDKMMLHPGKITLLPVLGTMLMIVFANKDTFVGAVLTTKCMVFIGLISYSLYLWHQPVIVFSKILFHQLTFFHWGGIFLLITFLSFISWRYIETTFRSQSLIKAPIFLSVLTIFMLILIVVSLWGYQSNGFIKYRYSKENINLLNDLDSDRNKNFLFKNLSSHNVIQSNFKKNNQPKMLIVGDSYAADFMNMIVANGYFSKYQIRTLYIPARCQLYLGDNHYRELIDQRDAKLCEQAQYKLKLLTHNIDKIDQTIFAFFWKPWVVEHINQSIQALDYHGENKLIFIGSKRFLINKRQALKSDERPLSELKASRSTKVMRVNDILAKSLKKHVFVDQESIFCKKDNLCPLFTPDQRPISVDGQHLTPEGASYLGKLLFKHPALMRLNKFGSSF